MPAGAHGPDLLDAAERAGALGGSRLSRFGEARRVPEAGHAGHRAHPSRAAAGFGGRLLSLEEAVHYELVGVRAFLQVRALLADGEIVDHRGAGDSMTAGVAAILARDGDLHEAVRTGAAAGALDVTRHGLGTGHRDAITELTTRVELVAVNAG